MSDAKHYIRAVLVVFWLLILTRIPAFIDGTWEPITIVSTVVEAGFFIWGIVILRNNVGRGSATRA